MQHPTIWLIEDEKPIADVLLYTLKTENFSVEWFERGLLALDALSEKQPDLILLDIGLPDISGFDLSRKIISLCDIPFIFLTARGEELDRIIGLELGADDYIVKPFSPREVSARIRVVLRRILPSEKESIKTSSIVKQTGNFSLDEESNTITYYNVLLNLTRYEYLLLKTLLAMPNRIYSRGQLLDIIWGDEESMERTVDTHIKTIRAKLSLVNDTHMPIITHRGFGYSMRV